MRCNDAWAALSATSEGGDPGILLDAEAHVRSCPYCAGDQELVRALTRLRLEGAPEPPPTLRNSILTATIGRSHIRRFLDQMRPLPQFALSAAAAALVYIVVASAPPGIDPNTAHQARLEGGSESDWRSSPHRVAANTTDARLQSAVPMKPVVRASQDPILKSAVREQSPALFVVSDSPKPGSDREMPKLVPRAAESRARADVPEPDRAAPISLPASENPKIERGPIDAPVQAESREPIRVARAEESPLPPPGVEVIEMNAASGMNPGAQSSYTMEAKSPMDPRGVASLADLRRSLQKENEEDSAPPNTFRVNDRRELRLAVHTSKF